MVPVQGPAGAREGCGGIHPGGQAGNGRRDEVPAGWAVFKRQPFKEDGGACAERHPTEGRQ